MPATSHADWSVTSSSGGYLGEYNLGLSYTPQGRHHFGFSLGYTADEWMGVIRQVSANYLYTPFEMEYQNWVFRPLEAGVVVTATGRKEYFVKSPGKYEDEHYYDVTKYRAGLMMGFSVGRRLAEDQVLRAGAFVTILEQGLFSAFNNGWSKALENFLSTGFRVSLDF